jgi:hypothetical protein
VAVDCKASHYCATAGFASVSPTEASRSHTDQSTTRRVGVCWISKMHHYRRKSGHTHPNTSMTDVRKAVTATDPSTRQKRPGMTRHHTPASAHKLGRNHREREREYHESWEEERESFPQYWYATDTRPTQPSYTDLCCASSMICEKQFVPHDERHLYCSETYVAGSPSALQHK